MIGSLKGKVSAWSPPTVLLEVQGVGYEIDVPLRSLEKVSQIGQEIFLWTHLLVREDAQLLYGFESADERDSFRRLIRVSGIGAKIALACLSSLSPMDISTAIHQEQLSVLSSVPGIGKKTAERMILELRSLWPKHSHNDCSPLMQAAKHTEESITEDVLAAMLQLGYKEKELLGVLQKIPQGLSLNESIRCALRLLNPHLKGGVS
jgi:Holliday junction DNA helicase RuvA